MYLFQTPFVRQNTPHPKELKAKAHKLFSKGKNDSRSASTDEQDVSQTFGLDKTETDSTKPNDLTADLVEQESLKHESVENEQKEIVPGVVTDNTDVQPSNEPEIVSNQYIIESNTVCIYNRLLYLITNYFIYLYLSLFFIIKIIF